MLKDIAGLLLVVMLLLAVNAWLTVNAHRDVKRALCELRGHIPKDMKKFQEHQYCLRCNNVIGARAIESDGPAMRLDYNLFDIVYKLGDRAGVLDED